MRKPPWRLFRVPDAQGGRRLQYLEHEKRPGIPAFQPVILAGVTDVKHLKAKIRPEDQHKVNSPWNIAADFDVFLSTCTTSSRASCFTRRS